MRYLEAFERTVRCYPDDTAVVTDDGRAFTYDEFDRRCTRLTAALHDRLGSGRVAVLANNGPAAVEAMMVGHERGAATVQLPFRGTAGELVEMTETAGAEGLLFDDANAETALEMLDRGEFAAAIHSGDRDLDTDGTAIEDYEAVLADAPAERPDGLPADGFASIFYTSGTTSTPKAVPFDGERLWYGAVQVVMEHGVDETDTAVVTTPWYHMVTADAWLYPHFMAGATVVLHSSFDAHEALELIETHDATGLLAVPTQLDALADAQAAAGYDLDSLSYVRTGGAVLPSALVERTRSLLSEGLYNTYGMTEAGPDLTFAHPSVQAERPGTIGKEAFTWELRVVEPAPVDRNPDPEATVDSGDRGEVIARGPGMAEGYIDNEAAEERTFFDGWLRTGDVARVDEDGYLYVVDRIDNMFVSGGENIYPAEVERVLETHENVAAACVVGVDDERWGQVVSAVVVPDGPVDPDDLEAFCKTHDALADYKRPREYVVSEEPLPRTDTGTLRRGWIAEDHFE